MKKSELLLKKLKNVKDPEIITAILEYYGLGATREVVATCDDWVVIAKIMDNCPEAWERRVYNSIPRNFRYNVLLEMDSPEILINQLPPIEFNNYIESSEEEIAVELKRWAA